jgi:dTMP kinase
MPVARFISFEGSEGAGKSTVIQAVAAHLSTRGIDHIITREPGGTTVGERIRALLLVPEQNIVADAELLLMYAARVQHYQTVIQPALQAGKQVLCDRFHDSSFAYQGYGRDLGIARLQILDDWALAGARPDRTVLLDVDPVTGLQRAGKTGVADRFEQEDLEFFQRVRQGFLERAKCEPKRFVVVDANQSETDTTHAVIRVFTDYWD